MDIRSMKLVFFSPTETTAKIVNKIAQGFNLDIVTGIDLPPPGARRRMVSQKHKLWKYSNQLVGYLEGCIGFLIQGMLKKKCCKNIT